jgi:hypothetical protein
MRTHLSVSRILAVFVRRYESLFEKDKGVVRDRTAAEPPWRNRHKITGSDLPTSPLLPRYQY